MTYFHPTPIWVIKNITLIPLEWWILKLMLHSSCWFSPRGQYKNYFATFLLFSTNILIQSTVLVVAKCSLVANKSKLPIQAVTIPWPTRSCWVATPIIPSYWPLVDEGYSLAISGGLRFSHPCLMPLSHLHISDSLAFLAGPACGTGSISEKTTGGPDFLCCALQLKFDFQDRMTTSPVSVVLMWTIGSHPVYFARLCDACNVHTRQTSHCIHQKSRYLGL